MENTQEIWKDIIGLEGRYQVSNIGNIKSLARIVLKSNGVNKIIKEILMKPSPDRSHSYLSIIIRTNGKSNNYSIHRLVAKLFVPNEFNKPEVNHINGIKTDNRAENLEWVTSSENTIHAYETSLCPSGESHYKSKLKELEVLDIFKRMNSGESWKLIASEYGVTRHNVYDIKYKRSWKLLLKNIQPPALPSANSTTPLQKK